ncbi:hypothetical protein LV35_04193 [Acinetobacter baumannii]|uniref:Uncharacterized protein n=1 Tax=Acinetobacter baumannii TaxID=470 RepID=A0AAJ0VMC4_ACIBA|nr:hypothetical protein LV35_04193 [Acinetobacter baumannii]
MILHKVGERLDLLEHRVDGLRRGYQAIGQAERRIDDVLKRLLEILGALVAEDLVDPPADGPDGIAKRLRRVNALLDELFQLARPLRLGDEARETRSSVREPGGEIGKEGCTGFRDFQKRIGEWRDSGLKILERFDDVVDDARNSLLRPGGHQLIRELIEHSVHRAGDARGQPHDFRLESVRQAAEALRHALEQSLLSSLLEVPEGAVNKVLDLQRCLLGRRREGLEGFGELLWIAHVLDGVPEAGDAERQRAKPCASSHKDGRGKGKALGGRDNGFHRRCHCDEQAAAHERAGSPRGDERQVGEHVADDAQTAATPTPTATAAPLLALAALLILGLFNLMEGSDSLLATADGLLDVLVGFPEVFEGFLGGVVRLAMLLFGLREALDHIVAVFLNPFEVLLGVLEDFGLFVEVSLAGGNLLIQGADIPLLQDAFLACRVDLFIEGLGLFVFAL